eukprot:UN02014
MKNCGSGGSTKSFLIARSHSGRSRAASEATEVFQMEQVELDLDVLDDEAGVSGSEFPAQSNFSFIEDALSEYTLYGFSLFQICIWCMILTFIYIFRDWLILFSFLFFAAYFLQYNASISPLLQDTLGPYLPCDWGKSIWLETKRGYRIHVYCHNEKLKRGNRCNILLVPDLGNSSFGFERIARKFASRMKTNVYAMDFEGHGLSGGRRGEFEFRNWITDIEDVAKLIYSKNKQPTVVIGSGFGSDAALRSCLKSHYIDGVVCSGLYLLQETTDLKFDNSFILQCLCNRWCKIIEVIFGNWVKVPLERIINFKKGFGYDIPDVDPRYYTRWRRNPLNTFSFGFRSLRSILSYKDNTIHSKVIKKPILMITAQYDEIISPEHSQ